MTTLAELRQLVRQQTETTQAELPDATVDNYLTQAFDRTVNAEVQWPFYENSWTLTQSAGDSTIPVPVDADPPGFMSLKNDSGWRLTQVDPEEAEDRFFGLTTTTQTPVNYSVWADVIQLWPQSTFDEDQTYTLRAFRTATRFPTATGGTTQAPDCDVRLHNALAHYATALAYAQQEDMELENQYMKRWQNDVEMARKIIMTPNQHRPLIMGPSSVYTTRIGNSGRSRGGPSSWSIRVP